jgi:hypothetical protein
MWSKITHSGKTYKKLTGVLYQLLLTENLKPFLGTFTHLRKAAINLLISFLAVSTNINNPAPGFVKPVTLYDLS